MREAENKKRTLEEEVDMLREDNAKMKAAGKFNLYWAWFLALSALNRMM